MKLKSMKKKTKNAMMVRSKKQHWKKKKFSFFRTCLTLSHRRKSLCQISFWPKRQSWVASTFVQTRLTLFPFTTFPSLLFSLSHLLAFFAQTASSNFESSAWKSFKFWNFLLFVHLGLLWIWLIALSELKARIFTSGYWNSRASDYRFWELRLVFE